VARDTPQPAAMSDRVTLRVVGGLALKAARRRWIVSNVAVAAHAANRAAQHAPVAAQC
jgi:hypothetical protein